MIFNKYNFFSSEKNTKRKIEFFVPFVFWISPGRKKIPSMEGKIKKREQQQQQSRQRKNECGCDCPGKFT